MSQLNQVLVEKFI